MTAAWSCRTGWRALPRLDVFRANLGLSDGALSTRIIKAKNARFISTYLPPKGPMRRRPPRRWLVSRCVFLVLLAAACGSPCEHPPEATVAVWNTSGSDHGVVSWSDVHRIRPDSNCVLLLDEAPWHSHSYLGCVWPGGATSAEAYWKASWPLLEPSEEAEAEAKWAALEAEVRLQLPALQADLVRRWSAWMTFEIQCRSQG